MAQQIKDTGQNITVSLLRVDRVKQRHDQINAYADSLNSYISGTLPNFIFNECFDWRKDLWEDFHSPVSLRWIILSKVPNKRALKTLLLSHDKRLKRVCKYKGEKVYPYITVPMLEITTYRLIKRRYGQL